MNVHSIETLSLEFRKAIENVKIDNTGKGMNVGLKDGYDLSDYITGVRVHPQADDWLASLVETICKKTT